MALIEANIDALVGPTHHFGGLGVGNVASQQHKAMTSHPREAALEGLRKAKLVAEKGVPQFLWLPPVRPNLPFLHTLGFKGSLQEVLSAAAVQAPAAFSAACSSAFMWAANSCTATPAVDAADQKYHFSPANLIASWHRGTEAAERAVDLSGLFNELSHVSIHSPLPSIWPLRDEGAANHMRLCDYHGLNGHHVFVHGDGSSTSDQFVARHSQAASRTLARRHQLNPDSTFFLQQHPDAIAAGVFHNDVIATSHRNLLIHHESAFLNAEQQLDRLEASFHASTGLPLIRIEISDEELPLADAVRSYFFNSQVISESGRFDSEAMTLVCPSSCEKTITARTLIERLISDASVPIESVHYVDLNQSMANGGGPACLRLRIPIDDSQLARLPSALRVTDDLIGRLSACIEQHYPESLTLADLTNAERVEHLLQIPDLLAKV